MRMSHTEAEESARQIITDDFLAILLELFRLDVGSGDVICDYDFLCQCHCLAGQPTPTGEQYDFFD